MTEQEFSDLMKAALTNDRKWQALTATEADADEARLWLADTRKQVMRDLSRKREEWGQVSDGLSINSREFKAALSDYRQWRTRAMGFLNMVEKRQAEANTLLRTMRRNRVAEESATLRDALLRAASVIEAHQAERATDADLYGLLDDIEIPHGIDGTLSLRSVLARTLAVTR